ncbi:receptor-like serine/threonine-protein kinase At1g78530 isoform X1 [Durio zibethinus]|uniref:Receptor-like serine/threonine-protein kinase At1g78530 isoform X1 n=1 Tax=Durio zibethinus TaxID=66656 RepID=A0A6P5WPI5_DURZI|nr:receptor-like serine/threonine-protein kinase At1g78530 isoform X1 [Durio zibethinus]XP_022717404.1 receptor-like serine/threonine-protein kinase At1g78530 isoform X1 [Durio zibethinus]XP_022717405.1 receptor-like serine/threonine-protein kinase At1g78530 isoform X1 [Durio zibethinus]XP_022717406.1 receptor-like serine/threonine-protein kinase At1g78530 isoform X1 [Durio zibethinus]XP_022717408.1 receptor-like serine/threonine-protein kinase At1g78530 isoform X1 [Durio zibethinus]XP_0227174
MANDLGIAFYITICCIAFIISKIILTILLYKRWKQKNVIYEEGFSGGKVVMFRSPVLQSLTSDVLLKKTLKLSNKDIIGAGGYGTVYRLMINDTLAFAVKRLNRGTADRDKGFERELEAMGDIKHRNIITLHGYYSSPHYNLLIYELMPNGSLDAFLHGKSMESKILDWPTRYKIALGAARGIAYLHHDCIPHIIHRDIKSSNILLDQNMEARVSDFGLATLMEPDKTHVSTFVAGTFGYLAPGTTNKIVVMLLPYCFDFFIIKFGSSAEYFDTGRATGKGDVYSFGVVLLELLTGKKPTDEAFLEEGTKLVTWVKGVVEERREEYVLDSSLSSCPVDEINNTFNIALMCLETDPSKRPTMAEVVKMLEQIKSGSAVTDS